MLLSVQDITGRFRRDGSLQQLIKMRCDACNQEFERTDKRCLTVERHCCSLKCGKQFRPRTRYVELCCLQCGDKFEKYVGYVRERNFCSKDCMCVHKREHPEQWPNNSAAMNTKEARESAKQSMKALRESPDYVHPRTGASLSEASIQLIKDARSANPLIGEKNGMFGRKHTEESKDAMSATRTQRMVEGKYKEYGKNNHRSGTYVSSKTGKEYWFRSSWELACMKYLDANENVVTWEYESVRISYIYDNHKRWYVPDFLITFTDKHSEMWELKPAKFCENEKTALKSRAAKQFCNENLISCFQILTKQCLIDRGIL